MDATGAGQWCPWQTIYETGIRPRKQYRGGRGETANFDPCRALAFDDTQELIFGGWGTGRLTVHTVHNMQLFAACYAHKSPVLEVISTPAGPLTLSKSGVRLHSTGGVPHTRLVAPIAAVGSDSQKLESKTTVGSAGGQAKKPAKDLRFSAMACSGNTLFVGDLDEQLHIYDLSLLGVRNVVRSYDLRIADKESQLGGVTCVATAGRGLVACGRANGAVTFYDKRTMGQALAARGHHQRKRSAHCGSLSVHRSFSAHTGGVSSIVVAGDMVISMGHSAKMRHRAIQDAAAAGGFGGAHCHSDNLVKVYDVRMMRLSMPLHYSFRSAPACGTLLPDGGCTLVSASYSGVLTLHDIRTEVSSAVMLQLPQQLPAEVTSIAASPSSQVVAVGDAAGGLHLCAMAAAGVQPSATFYNNPPPVQPAAVPPPPPQMPIPGNQEGFMLAPSGPSFGGDGHPYASSAYFVSRHPVHPYTPADMLSALPAEMAKSVCAPRPQRSIHPKLLAHTKVVDSIGCIDLVSLKSSENLSMSTGGSGLLFGADRAAAYVDLDPRRSGPSSRGRGIDDLSASVRRVDMGDGNIIYLDADGTEIERPPPHLRAVQLRLSRFGLEGFDFGRFNSTLYAGLENTQPNSFLNSLIQMLYFVPPVRYALMGHLSGTDSCLADELGFLFHMLDLAQDVPQKSKSVEPLNFARYFRQVPEAAALGLLEPSKLALPRRIGACARFLLEHVNKELKATEIATNRAANSGGSSSSRRGGRKPKATSLGAQCSPLGGGAIEQMFGCTFTNIDKFESGATKERESRSLVIDLIYPSDAETRRRASFASILEASLTRRTRVSRAWCDASSKYEPLVKQRSPKKMPALLCINCVPVEGDQHLALWRKGKKHHHQESKSATQQSQWLPASVTATCGTNRKFTIVAGAHRRGNSGGVTTVYDLVCVISHINDPATEAGRAGDAGHIIAHIYRQARGTGRAASWYTFNDFAVKQVPDVSEVFDFTGEWRQPCVLLYQKRGMMQDRRLSNPPIVPITPSVFSSPSLSLNGAAQKKMQTFQPLMADELPKEGDLVAIDCEFVSTGAGQFEVNADGRRVETKAVRLSLARVSVTRANGVPFIDDYILKTEPIVDYLTRFSGIVPGDLDPSLSTHFLVPLKAAYLKLRYLVDNGVIFVGHGLRKDFRMINILVPPAQVIDTVHLFHLPGQRLIGLRFLVKFLLGEGIQDASRGHDSIEDARGALQLYRKYLDLKERGEFETCLKRLYEEGHKCNWKV